MARARTLKPSFFKNEDLADLPMEARLLFSGLWCLADREGRMEDRPRKIKVEIFPYDQVDVDVLLNSLQDKKFIIRYEVNGERYVQISKFTEHQKPHHMEIPSEIPPPFDDEPLTIREQVDNEPTNSQFDPLYLESLNLESLNPISLSFDRKDKSERLSVSRETFSPEFLEFWEHYPKTRAGSKQKAWSAWQYAIKRTKALPSEIIAGCLAYAASEEVSNGFGKGCAAWLNDDRWKNDYSLKPQKTSQREDYFEGIMKSTIRGVAS